MKTTNDNGLELAKWVGGAAAGALLMYMLDPERGRARRQMTGEKVIGMGRQTTSALSNTLHGLGDRLGSGAAAAMGAASAAAGSAMDSVIGSAKDLASDARDRASGAASQAQSAMQSATQSATQAVNKPDGAARSLGQSVSDLSHNATQAVSRVASRAADTVMQTVRGRNDWSTMGSPASGALGPGMRNGALLGGGLLGVLGLMRRSPLGLAVGLAGVALLARGATNRPLRSLVSDLPNLMPNMLRSQPLSQTIDVEKSILIDARPEQVYEMWCNYENFPQFMSHVVEVRDLGRRRSHWVVKGPAGSQFEWDAVVTEQSFPHRLAWRSEPGAEVDTMGSVQFEPQRGGTRVTVRMSYTPPAGAVGHGIALLFGADPKRQMDEDLARMKSFIERGGLPSAAARKSRSSSRFLH